MIFLALGNVLRHRAAGPPAALALCVCPGHGECHCLEAPVQVPAESRWEGDGRAENEAAEAILFPQMNLGAPARQISGVSLKARKGRRPASRQPVVNRSASQRPVAGGTAASPERPLASRQPAVSLSASPARHQRYWRRVLLRLCGLPMFNKSRHGKSGSAGYTFLRKLIPATFKKHCRIHVSEKVGSCDVQNVLQETGFLESGILKVIQDTRL